MPSPPGGLKGWAKQPRPTKAQKQTQLSGGIFGVCIFFSCNKYFQPFVKVFPALKIKINCIWGPMLHLLLVKRIWNISPGLWLQVVLGGTGRAWTPQCSRMARNWHCQMEIRLWECWLEPPARKAAWFGVLKTAAVVSFLLWKLESKPAPPQPRGHLIDWKVPKPMSLVNLQAADGSLES